MEADRSSGSDIISVGNTTQNINVGNGNNSVTFNSPVITGSVTAGIGIDNAFLTASDAATASATSAFASKISGFDRLTINGSGTATIDLANLDNISILENSGTATLTLNNFANNGTVIASDSNGNIVNLANPSGANDTLNYSIQTPISATDSLTTSGIETINISSIDTELAPATINSNLLTLASTGAQTINITGDTNLALTATATSITSLDASALSGATFSWTSGALAAASTIRGSATAVNTINAGPAIAPVAYIGGNGGNNFTGGSANDTINGGTSADSLNGGSGQDVINSGGSGVIADIIIGGQQADLINIVGSNNAQIIQGNGDSGTNNATSLQTSVIASGFDRVIGTTNGVEIDLPQPLLGAVVNAQTLEGIDDFVSFATGNFANGVFTFNPNGSDTLATYDTTLGGSTNFESIVLSGFVVGSQTTLVANTVTLSNLSV